jgi:hypothetical protein
VRHAVRGTGTVRGAARGTRYVLPVLYEVRHAVRGTVRGAVLQYRYPIYIRHYQFLIIDSSKTAKGIFNNFNSRMERICIEDIGTCDGTVVSKSQ